MLESSTSPRICGNSNEAENPSKDLDSLVPARTLAGSGKQFQVRLFLMVVRQGTTNAHISDALRQGLPHLTAPDYLQDKSAARHLEGTRRKKGIVVMTSEHIVR
jgi:hypothetical protein